MKYLGFDISSSVIGWNYLEIKNGIIQTNKIEYGYILPPKKKDEIENLYDLTKILEDKFKKYKRRKDLTIAIEEFPFFISKGKGRFNSTARTITKLAIYTRATSLKLFDIFKIEPVFYKVATIRATLKKLSNNKDVKKENVPNCIEDIIENNTGKKWEFPFETNKNGNILKSVYDIADSFAVTINHAYKIGEIERQEK